MLSSSPRVVIVGFWCVVGFAIALWVAIEERARARRRLNLLESALRTQRANTLRITASRYVEFEEASDEGACYAFEIGPEEVIFVSGQDYYSSPSFPTGDFTLVDILNDKGEIAHTLVEKRGRKLAPFRVVSASRKASLRVPEHLTVFETTLEALENALAA